MNKKLSNRLAAAAAALFGAAAAAGVASPALAADNSAAVAEKAPAASERIADSDAFVNFRVLSVPAGTDSFEADDLVDEQMGTDGFSWG